ncbi:hypothetical protein FRC12_003151 [Ceratobasidium sp. 428]|nr:hypothetical protein FRC12_003151 [Ceratobasidium sp. 428]
MVHIRKALDSTGGINRASDLARYFGGDVDLDTISARTVEWHEDPGKLSRLPIDESLVAPENRIPRATSAVWYVHADFCFQT